MNITCAILRGGRTPRDGIFKTTMSPACAMHDEDSRVRQREEEIETLAPKAAATISREPSSSKTKLREIYAWNVNPTGHCKWRETRDSNEPVLSLSSPLYLTSQILRLLVRGSAWPGQVSSPDGKVWSMQRAEVEGKRSIHVCRLDGEGDRYLSRERVHLVPRSFSFAGIIQDHEMGKRFFERVRELLLKISFQLSNTVIMIIDYFREIKYLSSDRISFEQDSNVDNQCKRMKKIKNYSREESKTVW